MKTILLTSAGMSVRDEILKILPRPADRIKLAHIITASKAQTDLSYLEVEKRAISRLGFQAKNIDIEGKSESELRQLLYGQDVIYVQGGSAFYLLKCARESGFDRVAKELVERGVIYIGVSAGSYIACPTIEMANWKHQDRNTVGLTDLAGLNLVPFLVTVHYRPAFAAVLRKEIHAAKYPVRILTDEQALLIQDDVTELVGNGEEVKL